MLNILVVVMRAEVNVDLDVFLALDICEGVMVVHTNITNNATIIA
jgi:hypothetical protein